MATNWLQNWRWASLVAQRLRHLPGMRETRVRSLGREDPLAKEMAPHSSTLAWRIPWREEPGRLQSMGSKRVGHDWATSLSLFTFTFCFPTNWRIEWSQKWLGEGNGNPLQCSCLENPREGKPGWLPSMESHRVGHDWSDAAAAEVTRGIPLNVPVASQTQYLSLCSLSYPSNTNLFYMLSSDKSRLRIAQIGN